MVLDNAITICSVDKHDVREFSLTSTPACDEDGSVDSEDLREWFAHLLISSPWAMPVGYPSHVLKKPVLAYIADNMLSIGAPILLNGSLRTKPKEATTFNILQDVRDFETAPHAMMYYATGLQMGRTKHTAGHSRRPDVSCSNTATPLEHL